MGELFNTVPDDHFEGESNITKGQRKGPEGSRAGEILVDWMKRFKGGRETFGAGGNVDIVFAEPFDSDDYEVVFGSTTTTALPIYANKVETGFRITVAAAGDVDWMAIHNGQSS